jgi:hypothetical protein
LGILIEISHWWPVGLVGVAVGGVLLACTQCAVAEVVVRVAAYWSSPDPVVRRANCEEWLRLTKDMRPRERQEHAGTLLWLALKRAPTTLLGLATRGGAPGNVASLNWLLLDLGFFLVQVALITPFAALLWVASPRLEERLLRWSIRIHVVFAFYRMSNRQRRDELREAIYFAFRAGRWRYSRRREERREDRLEDDRRNQQSVERLALQNRIGGEFKAGPILIPIARRPQRPLAQK